MYSTRRGSPRMAAATGLVTLVVALPVAARAQTLFGLKLVSPNLKTVTTTRILKVEVTPAEKVQPINLQLGIRVHGHWTRVTRRGPGFSGSVRRVIVLRLSDAGGRLLSGKRTVKFRLVASRNGKIVKTAFATLR